MKKHKVVIVGSGFSGICMGIKLKQAGINDFVILEKAEQLGGTWRENTYPGAECDIPSTLYSYSFEPNPEWKHVWSKREQIFQYQQDVAQKYGLMPHFRFGERVNSADFNQGKWFINTTNSSFECLHLISAIGQLHERFTPDFDGQDQFLGAQFHAAKWNHEVDLNSKNVAVIGAAASAVQLIPEVAKQAHMLTVFQRTPNWMIEKPNREYTGFEKWLTKALPFMGKLYRGLWYLSAEAVLYQALRGNKIAFWMIEKLVHRNLNRHIKDPDLRAKLTPEYTIGAKRILFSHTFYRALNLRNVDLETQAIEKITPRGIQVADGSQIDADVIIYATGFITNPFFKSIQVRGRDQSLEQAWQHGAQGYLGVYANGFPNLHMMYGPNTNLGHNSIIIMIEAQANFIAKNIAQLDKQNGQFIEVSADLEAAYNKELQAKLAQMAFSKINKSWYMDNGKITNNWSGSTWEYKRRLKTHNPSSLIS